jgi:hypothetical protein
VCYWYVCDMSTDPDKCPLMGGQCSDAATSRFSCYVCWTLSQGNLIVSQCPSIRRDLSAEREDDMMTKLVAALSILVLGGGLSTALAQQAPTENKGMKAEALSGFALGKPGVG